MTDHRRRAEKVLREALGEKWHYPRLAELLGKIPASNLSICISEALKEVEEETWKRAIGCLEALAEKTDEPGELGYGIDIGIRKSLDALREEAAKK